MIKKTGEKNAKTIIEAQAVPTIVNGIAAVTSIIIAFGGTLIGIMFRDVFTNDKLAKEILIGLLVLFAFSVVFIFNAYFVLTISTLFSLENALRNALLALTFQLSY